MKVSVEEGRGLSRTVLVEIDAATVTQKLDSITHKIAKERQIPGGYTKFKAKVARARQMFRKEIAAAAAFELVESSLEEAFKQEGLKVVGQPSLVGFEEPVPGRPFEFKVEIEVAPEIPNPVYTKLPVVTQEIEVTSDEVDRVLLGYQEREAQLVPFEGERIEEGLYVRLALTPQVEDDAKRKALSNPDYCGFLEPDRFPQALVDALKGAPVNAEVEVQARVREIWPTKSEDSDLRVSWKVKVLDVKKKEVPVLDDQFALAYHGVSSLSALRSKIQEDLFRAKKRDAERTRDKILIEELLRRNKFTLPSKVFLSTYKGLVEEAEKEFDRDNPNIEPELARIIKAGIRQRKLEEATVELSLHFLLPAIAKKEGVVVEEAEVQERLESAAKEEGVAVEYYLSKLGEAARETIRLALEREKVMSVIIAQGMPIPAEVFEKERWQATERRLLFRKSRYVRFVTGRRRAIASRC